ncbi:MAG: hypothetical protein U1E76_05405 [Planctomycetota bacterium]
MVPLFGACSTAAVKDRCKDLSEVIDVVGSVAQGVQFQAHATQLVQAGVGSTIGWKAGLKNGHLDCWLEERNEFGLSLLYDHELFRSKGSSLLDVRHPLYGDPGYNSRFPEWQLLTDRDLLDVGIAVNIVYLGLDVNLRTYQIADFLTGIVGYDLLKDDCYAPALDELVARLRSDSARTRANAADALRRRTGEDMGYVQWTVRSETIAEQRDAARRFAEWLKQHEPSAAN